MNEKNRKRLLITDMDGTLLNRESQVSAENMAALEAYRRAGGYFTLATGRPRKALNMFPALLEQVNAPAILMNGGMIMDVDTGEVLYERFIQEGTENIFLEVLALWPTVALVGVQGEAGPICFRSNPEMEELFQREQRRGIPARLTDSDTQWNKLLFAGEHALLKEIESFLYERLGNGGRTVFSEPQFLEVLPTGVSKGSALKVLMELLQLEPNQVVAVGDGLNDLEMIECAGVGVAVANAVPALHTVADQVVCTNQEHAIRECIQRFF